jgi:hypothetical protein
MWGHTIQGAIFEADTDSPSDTVSCYYLDFGLLSLQNGEHIYIIFKLTNLRYTGIAEQKD